MSNVAKFTRIVTIVSSPKFLAGFREALAQLPMNYDAFGGGSTRYEAGRLVGTAVRVRGLMVPQSSGGMVTLYKELRRAGDLPDCRKVAAS